MAKARTIRRSTAAKFVGRKIAVAYNRHQCLPSHPKKKGEHCFPVRDKPSSSSKVLAYVDEVWLEDVSFFISPGGLRQIQSSGTRTVCCFVVGTVVSSKSPKVTGKSGWSEVRLDVFDHGCFYRVRDGACIRTAKYARLRNRKIEAFGSRKGDPVSSARELNPGPIPSQLPTYGPRRETWRGDLGGLNYAPAGAQEVVEALRWVRAKHPGCVIVDGSDDWEAPTQMRPELLAHQFGLSPIAWWHTGTSGQSRSGVVLSRDGYDRLASAYRLAFGADLELVGSVAPGLTRPGTCGCWEGEGLRVYSD